MATDDRYQEAIRTLRKDLGADLETFATINVRAFAGYVRAWLVANLDVDDLERLVDEMNATYRVNGRPVLDRPASGHER